MTKDPNERLTPTAALSHEWINRYNRNDHINSDCNNIDNNNYNNNNNDSNSSNNNIYESPRCIIM